MIKLVTGEAPLQVPTQFDIQLFAFLEYILVYFPVFQKKTIEQYPAFKKIHLFKLFNVCLRIDLQICSMKSLYRNSQIFC